MIPARPFYVLDPSGEQVDDADSRTAAERRADYLTFTTKQLHTVREVRAS